MAQFGSKSFKGCEKLKSFPGVNNLLELDVASAAFSGTPLAGKIESYWYE